MLYTMIQIQEQKVHVITDDEGYFTSCFNTESAAELDYAKIFQKDATSECKTVTIHYYYYTMTREEFDRIMDGKNIAHRSDIPDDIEDRDGNGIMYHMDVHPIPPCCTLDDDGYSQQHECSDSLVQGNGAGVIITEKCDRCGITKIKNTDAQCYDCGSKGHITIQYK